ncbi:hypothetical protein EsH8_XII_000059 [Colletotrichum jinshuiense]
MPVTRAQAVQCSNTPTDSAVEPSLDAAVKTFIDTATLAHSSIEASWSRLKQTYIQVSIRISKAYVKPHHPLPHHLPPFPLWIEKAVLDRRLVHLSLQATHGEHWSTKVTTNRAEAGYRKRAARHLGLDDHFELYLWFGERKVETRSCWENFPEHITKHDLFDRLEAQRATIHDQRSYLTHPYTVGEFAAAKAFLRANPPRPAVDANRLNKTPKPNINATPTTKPVTQEGSGQQRSRRPPTPVSSQAQQTAQAKFTAMPSSFVRALISTNITPYGSDRSKSIQAADNVQATKPSTLTRSSTDAVRADAMASNGQTNNENITGSQDVLQDSDFQDSAMFVSDAEERESTDEGSGLDTDSGDERTGGKDPDATSTEMPLPPEMTKEPASKSVESEETVLRGTINRVWQWNPYRDYGLTNRIRAIAPHLQHQAEYRAEAEDQQAESEQNLAELEAQYEKQVQLRKQALREQDGNLDAGESEWTKEALGAAGAAADIATTEADMARCIRRKRLAARALEAHASKRARQSRALQKLASALEKYEEIITEALPSLGGNKF